MSNKLLVSVLIYFNVFIHLFIVYSFFFLIVNRRPRKFVTCLKKKII